MERKLRIGMAVVFIDENRQERDALVTAIHGDPCGSNGYWPCVNLVVADKNEEAQDQYGRQLSRHSSVAHWEQNSAHGYCWRFSDEEMTGGAAPTIS